MNFNLQSDGKVSQTHDCFSLVPPKMALGFETMTLIFA